MLNIQAATDTKQTVYAAKGHKYQRPCCGGHYGKGGYQQRLSIEATAKLNDEIYCDELHIEDKYRPILSALTILLPPEIVGT